MAPSAPSAPAPVIGVKRSHDSDHGKGKSVLKPDPNKKPKTSSSPDSKGKGASGSPQGSSGEPSSSGGSSPGQSQTSSVASSRAASPKQDPGQYDREFFNFIALCHEAEAACKERNSSASNESSEDAAEDADGDATMTSDDNAITSSTSPSPSPPAPPPEHAFERRPNTMAPPPRPILSARRRNQQASIIRPAPGTEPSPDDLAGDLARTSISPPANRRRSVRGVQQPTPSPTPPPTAAVSRPLRTVMQTHRPLNEVQWSDVRARPRSYPAPS